MQRNNSGHGASGVVLLASFVSYVREVIRIDACLLGCFRSAEVREGRLRPSISSRHVTCQQTRTWTGVHWRREGKRCSCNFVLCNEEGSWWRCIGFTVCRNKFTFSPLTRYPTFWGNSAAPRPISQLLKLKMFILCNTSATFTRDRQFIKTTTTVRSPERRDHLALRSGLSDRHTLRERVCAQWNSLLVPVVLVKVGCQQRSALSDNGPVRSIKVRSARHNTAEVGLQAHGRFIPTSECTSTCHLPLDATLTDREFRQGTLAACHRFWEASDRCNSTPPAPRVRLLRDFHVFVFKWLVQLPSIVCRTRRVHRETRDREAGCAPRFCAGSHRAHLYGCAAPHLARRALGTSICTSPPPFSARAAPPQGSPVTARPRKLLCVRPCARHDGLAEGRGSHAAPPVSQPPGADPNAKPHMN